MFTIAKFFVGEKKKDVSSLAIYIGIFSLKRYICMQVNGNWYSVLTTQTYNVIIYMQLLTMLLLQQLKDC